MRFWSFSTTVRNPERIREFLKVLKDLEGFEWNKDTQSLFQIKLIEKKLYGFGSKQFYNGLTNQQIKNIESNDFTFKQAKEIFHSKNYNDPPMRGRQSFNPISKLGFVIIEEKSKNKKIIKITDLGNKFIDESIPLKEIFLKSLLKWQYPNPDDNKYKYEQGYDIKPFIASLKLIKIVNNICLKNNLKQKGVSRNEFALFFVSLINYKDLEKTAINLINFRIEHEKIKNRREQQEYTIQYFKEYYGAFESWKNANEYTDNILRYFRLTGFIYIRGNGYYIDLEPRRNIEIEKLLEKDSANSINFASKREYFEYIGNPELPELPWENIFSLKLVKKNLLIEINKIKLVLDKNNIKYKEFSFKEKVIDETKILSKYNEQLRNYLLELNDLIIKNKSQELDQIKEYIFSLKNIYDIKFNRPVYLEKFIYLGLNALNDALNIKPNYPVGDDNEPTFTAPANHPDIECFYTNFNTICEVTLLTDRTQWYSEGQPILRHLRDFENKHPGKESYCIFVAPKLHRDTINTFWMAVKYEYEGVKQKIVPFTIEQFIELLEILVIIRQRNNKLNHLVLKDLFEEIIQSSNKLTNSEKWIKEIPNTIKKWSNKVV